MIRSRIAALFFLGAVLPACTEPLGGLVLVDGGTDTDGGGVGSSDGGGVECGLCSGGTICSNGACVCPRYQTSCNGNCIPTSADPNNCGGCGIACTGATACSSSVCSSDCLPGLSICSNTCVDTDSDTAHCGQCNRACGAGMGCAGSRCVASAPLGDRSAECIGGGPPIFIDDMVCAGDVAATSFTWALCSCDEVVLGTKLLTDAFDSSKGPYSPGGLGGGVGLNGALSTQSTGDVWASGFTLDVSGFVWSAGALSSDAATIGRQELHVGGPLAVNRFDVLLDAFVRGDVSGDPLSIAGALHQTEGASTNGNVTYRELIHEPIDVPPPCSCADDQRVPIVAVVTSHRADNENALIGLDPALLAGSASSAPARVDLPCGRFYLSGVNATDDLTIIAHGRTAIFVEGDFVAGGQVHIAPDPSGELDLFISGNLRVPNGLTIGSPNYPALTRVYVGGTGSMEISNNVTIAGNFYAPKTRVIWSSPTEAYGAVFAGTFVGESEVQIHYDRNVLDQSCRDDPNLPPDYPTAGPPCASCLDCANQACAGGACGACSVDTDCCRPLSCVSGSCVLSF